MDKTRTFLSVAILLGLSLSSSVYAQQHTESVRFTYDGSTNTPIHLVFMGLTSTVYALSEKKGQDRAQHHVFHLLDYEHGNLEHETAASEIAEHLLAAHYAMQRERLRATYESLCFSEALTATEDQTFQSIDALDAIAFAAAEKHYRLFMAKLDISTSDQILAYLEKGKTSFHFVAFDSKKQYEELNLDIKQTVSDVCAAIPSQLENLPK